MLRAFSLLPSLNPAQYTPCLSAAVSVGEGSPSCPTPSPFPAPSSFLVSPPPENRVALSLIGTQKTLCLSIPAVSLAEIDGKTPSCPYTRFVCVSHGVITPWKSVWSFPVPSVPLFSVWTKAPFPPPSHPPLMRTVQEVPLSAPAEDPSLVSRPVSECPCTPLVLKSILCAVVPPKSATSAILRRRWGTPHHCASSTRQATLHRPSTSLYPPPSRPSLVRHLNVGSFRLCDADCFFEDCREVTAFV